VKIVFDPFPPPPGTLLFGSLHMSNEIVSQTVTLQQTGGNPSLIKFGELVFDPFPPSPRHPPFWLPYKCSRYLSPRLQTLNKLAESPSLIKFVRLVFDPFRPPPGTLLFCSYKCLMQLSPRLQTLNKLAESPSLQLSNEKHPPGPPDLFSFTNGDLGASRDPDWGLLAAAPGTSPNPTLSIGFSRRIRLRVGRPQGDK